jgi:Flp pilus assembly pilin Flp
MRLRIAVPIGTKAKQIEMAIDYHFTLRRQGRHRKERKKGSPLNNGIDCELDQRAGDQAGQGLAEYALILALIAIVAIIALIFLGGQVSTILSTVGGSI